MFLQGRVPPRVTLSVFVFQSSRPLGAMVRGGKARQAMRVGPWPASLKRGAGSNIQPVDPLQLVPHNLQPVRANGGVGKVGPLACKKNVCVLTCVGLGSDN